MLLLSNRFFFYCLLPACRAIVNIHTRQHGGCDSPVNGGTQQGTCLRDSPSRVSSDAYRMADVWELDETVLITMAVLPSSVAVFSIFCLCFVCKNKAAKYRTPPLAPSYSNENWSPVNPTKKGGSYGSINRENLTQSTLTKSPLRQTSPVMQRLLPDQLCNRYTEPNAAPWTSTFELASCIIMFFVMVSGNEGCINCDCVYLLFPVDRRSFLEALLTSSQLSGRMGGFGYICCCVLF